MGYVIPIFRSGMVPFDLFFVKKTSLDEKPSRSSSCRNSNCRRSNSRSNTMRRLRFPEYLFFFVWKIRFFSIRLEHSKLNLSSIQLHKTNSNTKDVNKAMRVALDGAWHKPEDKSCRGGLIGWRQVPVLRWSSESIRWVSGGRYVRCCVWLTYP